MIGTPQRMQYLEPRGVVHPHLLHVVMVVERSKTCGN